MPAFFYVNYVTYYRADIARLSAFYSREVTQTKKSTYFRANIARAFFLYYICAYEEH